MDKPKILIVGAGAVGLTQGYHLSFAADITFLVRPGRKSAFVAPKRLYDYRENALHTFSNYQVIESTSEVPANTSFLFVLDTLNGHAARSESGMQTLRAVGALIRDTPAFVFYDAVGVGIRTHYATTMGISKERCFLAISMLAHQPTPAISVPDSADRDLVAQADMLYIDSPKGHGLSIYKSNLPHAKVLAETYAANGKLTVGTIPTIAQPLFDAIMVHLVVWFLDGFRPFPHLRANAELWGLLMRAQGEVFSLPRSGWMGTVFYWVFGSWVTAKLMFQNMVDMAMPLSYHEFNRFHHGGKVISQDVDMLRQLVKEGEGAGKKVKALREVMERAEEKYRVEVVESGGEGGVGTEGLRKRNPNEGGTGSQSGA